MPACKDGASLCRVRKLASHAKRSRRLQDSPERNPCWRQQQEVQQRLPQPPACRDQGAGLWAAEAAVRETGRGGRALAGGGGGGGGGALPPPPPPLLLLLGALSLFCRRPWLARRLDLLPNLRELRRLSRQLLPAPCVLLPVSRKCSLHRRRQREPHHHRAPYVRQPAALLGRWAGQLGGAAWRHRLHCQACAAYESRALAWPLRQGGMHRRKAAHAPQGGAQRQQLCPEVVLERQREQQRQQR